MKRRTIHTLAELGAFGEEVLTTFSAQEKAPVLALTGDLGAGKTAFVKELAKHLGIKEEVTSPTFVVMKSYAIPAHPFLKTLTHIDAYRIESEDEMRVLGFTELLDDPTRLIALEWPERIAALVPADAHTITLAIEGDARTITYGS